MTLLDLLLSLADAPNPGVGPGTAAAASATGAGASSPPMCMAPPPELPLGWDKVFDPDPIDPDDIDPRPHEPHEPGTDSFFFPESGVRDYVTLGKLREYGDWLKKGSKGERAAKAATGLVVVPIGAILACAEESFRSPVTGGGPTPARPR